MIYAEMDNEENVRGIVSVGKLRKRVSIGKFKKLNDVNPKETLASLTDGSIVNKVYTFPSQLNKKQLSIAIAQKVSTDAEFSILREPEYIDSKLVCGANCDYLISAIDNKTINKFRGLKALTATPQVVADSLPRENRAFMLIHSFGKNTFIFIVKNGIVDSVRNISSNNLTDSFIASTLEFYKERKRTNIDEFYYSGNRKPIEKLNYKILPITNLRSISDMAKKVGFSEDEFTEFFVPILLYLNEKSLPFLFKRVSINLSPVLIPISVSLILASIPYSLSYISSRSSIGKLSSELKKMLKKKNSMDGKVKKVQTAINDRKKFLKSTNYLANLSYPMIYNFIESLKPVSKSYKTYILSFSCKGNNVDMKTITFNPEINFSGFLGILSGNSYIENLKILSIVTSKELNAKLCNFSFKIRNKRYE